MTTGRVNVNTPRLPDPQVTAWLEANKIDPGVVLADQAVLVTEDAIVYISWPGWPEGPKVMSDSGGYHKEARMAPLLQRPEAFGLTVEEDTK